MAYDATVAQPVLIAGGIGVTPLMPMLRRASDNGADWTFYYGGRSLQSMADDGQVEVIVRGDGESVYRQCSPSHHHHLVCRSCRSTVEIDAPDVERWATDVAAQHGFRDVTHTVEVFGVCSRCAD